MKQYTSLTIIYAVHVLSLLEVHCRPKGLHILLGTRKIHQEPWTVLFSTRKIDKKPWIVMLSTRKIDQEPRIVKLSRKNRPRTWKCIVKYKTD